VFAAFGPRIPDGDELARRIRNPELGEHGMRLLRRFDAVDQLARIRCPTLVCVGRQDPVTPVEAAREIAEHLDPAAARLAVLDDTGHFPWLDRPDRYWDLLRQGLNTAAATIAQTEGVLSGTVPDQVVIQESDILKTRGFMQIPNNQITLSNGVLVQNEGWK
jgi:hypothetical protein